MTRPTTRVLALLEILQTGAAFTVGELARRLGVDERTVRRYVGHLADLGVPVESRRGRYGGYRLAPGYRLPPLMLTDDEAVALALGLVAGERTGLTAGEGVAAEGAAAKLRRVLPAALARRVDSLLATVELTAPRRTAPPTGLAAVADLAESARARHPVTIGYTSWQGRVSERRLDPYGLVFHAGRWYVTGFDHDRAAVRTFRVDRITAVAAGTGTFEIPEGFEPTATVLAGLAAVPWKYEVSVVLRTSLAEARHRIPPSVGTLTELPDGVRLVTRAEHLDGAAQMLAGLGWPFRIEHPTELAAEVCALADRLRANAT
ncbi:helix-turn-helix transcriptional regulator [Actinocatenispora rupis]|uniref:Transcriptional regulator n=1 Tax=Actinocatenispora rupis TaxID=519421 RepID=A0A8J3NC10_9ACTN|nr:YafY family protein [Actinocatenispora rupis]GID11360.1 transcriptional regulator [Actinocatenispora rupis]